MKFDFEKEIVDDKMYSVDIISFTKMNKLHTHCPLRMNRSIIVSKLSNSKEIIPKDILYSKYMSNSKIKKFHIDSAKMFTELINVSMTKTQNGVMPFNGYELKEMIARIYLNHNKHHVNPEYIIILMIKTDKFFEEGFHEFMVILRKDKLWYDTTLEYVQLKDQFIRERTDGVRLPNKYADFKRTAIWLHSFIKFDNYDTNINPETVTKMAVC